MGLALMVDLDDLSNCPTQGSCSTCGSGFDLEVTTIEMPVGVGCVTLCASCLEAAELPRLGWVSGVEIAAAHAGHLGIDVDEMAELMKREESQ